MSVLSCLQQARAVEFHSSAASIELVLWALDCRCKQPRQRWPTRTDASIPGKEDLAIVSFTFCTAAPEVPAVPKPDWI